ncbi:4257_t:CDS:2, partial [Paraglomus occultum]
LPITEEQLFEVLKDQINGIAFHQETNFLEITLKEPPMTKTLLTEMMTETLKKSISNSTNKTPKIVDQQTITPTASSSKSSITPTNSNNTPAASASQQFYTPMHQSSPYIPVAAVFNQKDITDNHSSTFQNSASQHLFLKENMTIYEAAGWLSEPEQTSLLEL